MPKIEVTIEKDILDWIISQEELLSIDEQTLMLLKDWRDGKKRPTMAQIEKVSKKTRIPFGYFFLKQPPKEEFPLTEFRTVDSGLAPLASRNLQDVVAHMEQVQAWMSQYYQANDYAPAACVGCCAGASRPEPVVSSLREMLGVSIDWLVAGKFTETEEVFKCLRRALESCRVLVMMNGVVGNNTRRKLQVTEFRAFTLIDKYAPLIFINTTDAITARVFSLIHEAAHIWIGRNSLYNLSNSSIQPVNKIERLCNAVAAEFLVPETLFVRFWEEHMGHDLEQCIQTIAERFLCSREVIARRALDCGFITSVEYGELIAKWKGQQEKNKQKSSGGNFYRTTQSRLDPNFVIALYRDTRAGRTMFTDAYRLTGLNRGNFDQLVSQLMRA